MAWGRQRAARNKAFLSSDFIRAVHRFEKPKRVLAEAAGISIGVLSHWMEGVNRAGKDDPRILKIADILHFPPEKIFESEFA